MLYPNYTQLGTALNSLGKETESISISISQEFEQFILKIEKNSRDIGAPKDFSAYWPDCYHNLAISYAGLKNIEKAEYYYKKLCDCQAKSTGYSNLTTLAEIEIVKLKGDIPQLLTIIDSLVNREKDNRNSFFISTLLKEKADNLMTINQFEQASKIYRDVIILSDSINEQQLALQLDDLRSVYELDHLTAEKEKNGLYAIIAFTGCLFLIILLIIYVLYSRRLKEKNRNLFNRIQELARLEKVQQRIEREELLVKRLRVWLNTDNRFTQPDINRKQMADNLGTNEKYLADAIRNQCGGQTVNDFVNLFRIKHARKLLEENQQITALSVAIESGISTRITLFRLFRRHFNMSPTKFRKQCQIHP